MECQAQVAMWAVTVVETSGVAETAGAPRAMAAAGAEDEAALVMVAVGTGARSAATAPTAAVHQEVVGRAQTPAVVA
jgi:hypothetical protein